MVLKPTPSLLMLKVLGCPRDYSKYHKPSPHFLNFDLVGKIGTSSPDVFQSEDASKNVPSQLKLRLSNVCLQKRACTTTAYLAGQTRPTGSIA